MRLPRSRPRTAQESTITLINVVFLMLIFFLIAGTLTPPMESDVSLITTSESDRAEPPQALFVTSDGTLKSRGAEITAADYVARVRQENLLFEDETVAIKLGADRDLPAERLIEIVGELRDAGAATIAVVTERAEP